MNRYAMLLHALALIPTLSLIGQALWIGPPHGSDLRRVDREELASVEGQVSLAPRAQDVHSYSEGTALHELRGLGITIKLSDDVLSPTVPQTNWAQWLVWQVAMKMPRKNIVVYHDQRCEMHLVNDRHDHIEVFDADAGRNRSYEVHAFESGTFHPAGDDGFDNWAVLGNYTRNADSPDLTFYPFAPLRSHPPAERRRVEGEEVAVAEVQTRAVSVPEHGLEKRIIPLLMGLAIFLITQFSRGSPVSQEDFTKMTLDNVSKRYPGKNVLVYHNRDSYTYLVNDLSDHLELPIGGFGRTKGYEVHVFDYGAFHRAGDGGYGNWACMGNFSRQKDSPDVTFFPIEPLRPLLPPADNNGTIGTDGTDGNNGNNGTDCTEDHHGGSQHAPALRLACRASDFDCMHISAACQGLNVMCKQQHMAIHPAAAPVDASSPPAHGHLGAPVLPPPPASAPEVIVVPPQSPERSRAGGGGGAAAATAGTYMVSCTHGDLKAPSAGLAHYKNLVPYGGNAGQQPDDFAWAALDVGGDLSAASWAGPSSGVAAFAAANATFRWSVFGGAQDREVAHNDTVGRADDGLDRFWLYKDAGDVLFSNGGWDCRSMYWAF